MNKPNFLIVGVPKAGTTSLYHYLNKHPNIFLPQQKELHYFSYDRLQECTNGPGDKEALDPVIKTWEQYVSLYTESNAKMMGEASPSYFYFSDIIPLIKRKLGTNIKIIILLRDPIERAYSNYLHQRKMFNETLSFKKATAVEAKRKRKGYGDFWRYTEHSLYYKKCKDYVHGFGKENVQIILFEDIRDHPIAVLEKIFSTLGVKPHSLSANDYKAYNKSVLYKNNITANFIRGDSKLKALISKMLGKKGLNRLQGLKQKILKNNKIEIKPIDEEVVTDLQHKFYDDVHNLQKNFQIDISRWKYFGN